MDHDPTFKSFRLLYLAPAHNVKPLLLTLVINYFKIKHFLVFR